MGYSSVFNFICTTTTNVFVKQDSVILFQTNMEINVSTADRLFYVDISYSNEPYSPADWCKNMTELWDLW